MPAKTGIQRTSCAPCANCIPALAGSRLCAAMTIWATDPNTSGGRESHRFAVAAFFARRFIVRWLTHVAGSPLDLLQYWHLFRGPHSKLDQVARLYQNSPFQRPLEVIKRLN